MPGRCDGAGPIADLTNTSSTLVHEEYPFLTWIISKLHIHDKALLIIFLSDDTFLLPLRPTNANNVSYCVVNVSADGISFFIQYPDGGVKGRDGL